MWLPETTAVTAIRPLQRLWDAWNKSHNLPSMTHTLPLKTNETKNQTKDRTNNP